MRFRLIKEYFSLLLTIILLHVRFTAEFFIFCEKKGNKTVDLRLNTTFHEK